ncbi:hypothetical protein [Candidatus Nitrosotalea bavarica]|uniref:hypothetical protein n=1 Tax=Candidatus Nitrosotalea bavarica TaxID=1903277 RepID=UPI000C6FFD68|nr:hypothetical protein [Candidatus Nitrosotalea bavarica]
MFTDKVNVSYVKYKKDNYVKSQEIILDGFVVRCTICKTKFVIPDMGPCTDLEYEKYIKDSGFVCKCGKNDWFLDSD